MYYFPTHFTASTGSSLRPHIIPSTVSPAPPQPPPAPLPGLHVLCSLSCFHRGQLSNKLSLDQHLSLEVYVDRNRTDESEKLKGVSSFKMCKPYSRRILVARVKNIEIRCQRHNRYWTFQSAHVSSPVQAKGHGGEENRGMAENWN